MILTKQAIRQRLMSDIVITPFEEKRLNPNSYNLTLGNKFLIYNREFSGISVQTQAGQYTKPGQALPLDPKKPNSYYLTEVKDGESFLLNPGELYLAQTAEYTETHNLVPMIEGRSSWGRLGLFIHVTAGFGDIGFCGHWTLEMMVVRPLLVYPGMEIAQIFYHTVEGEPEPYASNKYQNNRGVQPSMLWKEFTS